MHATRRYNPAFALIITLITLSISLATFTALSQLALDENWKSQTQEASLQNKWLTYSAQKVLLPRSQDALSMAHPLAGRQNPTWEFQAVMPTGTKIYLKIEDEQSKINLNSRFIKFNDSNALALTQRFMEQSKKPLVLNWAPSLPALQSSLSSSGKMNPNLRLPPFCGWRQIFSTKPAPTLQGENPFPVITSFLTLWGDGRINFKSASDQVLIESLAPFVSQDKIGALVDIRARFPGMALDSLMDQIGLSGHARTMTAESVVDRSKAFSLWIKIEDSRSVRTTCWSREELDKNQISISRTDW